VIYISARWCVYLFIHYYAM